MANAATARLKSLPLPLAMALLTGVSIIPIVFMLPADALEGLVVQMGLPAILAAAEPPLGTTARGLLASVGAISVGAAVWILMRALEGLPNIRLPRLRRGADGALFSAPAVAPKARPEPEFQRRRPILAGADLGAPFHSVKAPEPAPKAEPAPVLEAEITPEPEADCDWLEETVVEEIEAIAPVPAQPLEVVAPAVDKRPAETDSIAALVERLEAGIERRRLALVSSRDVPAQPSAPGPMAPDIDAALRDALGTLQRMAARPR